ncbi:hypothetical protein OKW36_006051 [Paraburkholderia sp. MM5482-R1]
MPVPVDEPLVRERVDVIGERKRHDVGLQSVEHRASLRARAAVRLPEGDGFAGPGLPFLAECLIDVLIQFARRIVGHVQQRGVGVRYAACAQHAERTGRADGERRDQFSGSSRKPHMPMVHFNFSPRDGPLMSVWCCSASRSRAHERQPEASLSKRFHY